MGKISLMIADDHPVVINGVKDALERDERIEVVSEVANGREALRVALEVGPDVCLTDLKLPGIDGIELTQRIKEKVPRVAVVVFACCEMEAQALQSVKVGADGFVPKDAPLSDLVDAVYVVADGGSFLHPRIARALMGELRCGNGSEPRRTGELTNREEQILALMARGFRNSEIGRELWISETTVKAHVGSIFKKFGTRDRVKTIIEAVKKGMVDLGEQG